MLQAHMTAVTFARIPRREKLLFALAACLTSFLLFASFAKWSEHHQHRGRTAAASHHANRRRYSRANGCHPGFAKATFMSPHPTPQYVFQMSVVTPWYAFVGMGWVGYWGKSVTRLKGLLAEPTGLAVDAQGNLYIADAGNNAIRKVDTSGNLSTVAGLSEPCPHAKCVVMAACNKFEIEWVCRGVAVDSKGNGEQYRGHRRQPGARRPRRSLADAVVRRNP